ncbi:uncharacterized protein LOC117628881 [Prunus dulcis]|uniref:uncharacterized protein LOC117628881 n=1 Tax=Prunus dulcis TaxID=3755 RepID=UPI001481E0F3|nr:uncharacterized protein LOC117628881 [Prunus dulcis]
MLNVNDKLGGVPVCRLKGFRSWFDCNAMIDLGFSGRKFTWNNKRVFERLDRAICNLEWRRLFAEATVRHLPRTMSDHNPIKICLTSCFSASPALRPFRFEAMWLHHEKFNDFISEAWGPGDGTAVEKTFALIERLKHWNINVFGQLRQRKSWLLARIAGIQRALCKGPNRFLSNLETSLIDDFNNVLQQEAVFWQQKSRITWLQDGDRNTKFFHTTTIIRRKRNKIERLKNANGIWIEEANSLKILAVDHFSNLFSTTSLGDYVIDPPNLFPPVDVVDLHGLVQPINMTEVKTSLFNIGGLKAPGADGFPACFYQSQWNQCVDDIFQMVVNAFKECRIPKKLNYTLIT